MGTTKHLTSKDVLAKRKDTITKMGRQPGGCGHLMSAIEDAQQ